MKLGDWLKANGVTRADFARRIGVSAGAVTLICREDRAWLCARRRSESLLKRTAPSRPTISSSTRPEDAKDTTCIIP
jgi:transcriptional regulator with XRE-family HTH domain